MVMLGVRKLVIANPDIFQVWTKNIQEGVVVAVEVKDIKEKNQTSYPTQQSAGTNLVSQSFKPEDNRALLKIHYGKSFDYDSDNESVASVVSNDPAYELYRPAPYSYEDIKSRLVVVGGGASATMSRSNNPQDVFNPEVGKNTRDWEEAELKKSMTLDYCKLCLAGFGTPEQAMEHYSSKGHANLVKYWFGNDLYQKSKNFFGQSGNIKTLLNPNNKIENNAIANRTVKNEKKLLSTTTNQKAQSEMFDKRKINLSNNSKSSMGSALASVTPLYCVICKMPCANREGIEKHVGSFVHQETLNLVTTLIGRGIPVEAFWLNMLKTTVTVKYCKLCQKRFLSEISAIDHSKSRLHKQKVKDWISNHKQYSSPFARVEFEEKICYCKICDVYLDGTTRSAVHYTHCSHQRFLETYCQLCKVQTKTLENYQKHLSSSQHEQEASATASTSLCHLKETNPVTINTNSGHASKQIEKQIGKTADEKSNTNVKSENNKPENKTTKTSITFQEKHDSLLETLNKNSFGLDDEVSKELKKLADTIYYSNIIPLELSLKYLQRFNKELDQIMIDIPNRTQESRRVNLNIDDLNCNKIKNKANIKSSVPVVTKENVKPINEYDEANEMIITTSKNYCDVNTKSIHNGSIDSCCSKDVKVQVIIGNESKPDIPILPLQSQCNGENKLINNLEAIKEPNNEVESELKKSVFNELNKFVNSVMLSCLKSFNKELDNYVQENSKVTNGFTKNDQHINLGTVENVSKSKININAKEHNAEKKYIDTEKRFEGEISSSKQPNLETKNKTLEKVTESKHTLNSCKEFSEETAAWIIYERDNYESYYKDENFEDFIKFKEIYVNKSLEEVIASSYDLKINLNIQGGNNDLNKNKLKSKKKASKLKDKNKTNIKFNVTGISSCKELIKVTPSWIVYEQDNYRSYYEDENFEKFIKFKEIYVNKSLDKSIASSYEKKASKGNISCFKKLNLEDKNETYIEFKENKENLVGTINGDNVSSYKELIEVTPSWIVHERDSFRPYYEDKNFKEFIHFKEIYMNKSLEKVIASSYDSKINLNI